jgi:hypothetical protein
MRRRFPSPSKSCATTCPLVSGLEPEFTLYMKYVTSLQFEEDPDYDFCKRLFFDLLSDLKQQGREPQFQWLNEDGVVYL